MADAKSLPERPEPALTIERSPYGGFTVWPAAGGIPTGYERRPLYSCSELDEAFSWMRSAMQGQWDVEAKDAGD